MKHLILPFLAICLLACSNSKNLTLASLEPVVKIFVNENVEGRLSPVYSMTIFNDRHADYHGYGRSAKTGNFGIVLDEKQYQSILHRLEKIKQPHFNYTDFDTHYTTDVTYKGMSLSAIARVPTVELNKEKTLDLKLFDLDIEGIFKNPNWLTERDIPKLVGDAVENEFLISLTSKTNATTWITKHASNGLKFKKSLDISQNYWLASYNKNSLAPNAMLEKIRKDSSVLGVIFNRQLTPPMAIIAQKEAAIQELIIDFAPNTSIEKWIEKYPNYGLRMIKKVAPDGNLWLASYDTKTLGLEAMLELLKKDADIKKVQANAKAQMRG
ncbi:MAG: hypothetical protein RLZZ292_2138 [Bacteroidota bacterium]|jgi:hypothetical protein